MQYISSDTNVWIDFLIIERLDLPFRLNHTYCMSSDAIRDELLSPPGCSDKLLSLGLQPIEIDDDELLLTIEYGLQYPKLSTYDRIALAIAKNRQIILLTGDGVLRKAAVEQKVQVKGTIWILDMLLDELLISKEEYRSALLALQDANGFEVRLPGEEIRKRLNR